MARRVPLSVLSLPTLHAGLMLALLTGSMLGCAEQRELARSHNVLMSTADEEKIGEEEAQSVASRVGFLDDEDIQSYVQDIGERLARNSPRHEVNYRFHVVEMVEPNAFALPGGHIYVSRGLLALVNSEEELANVLAHEVAHVALQHHAYRELEVRKAKVVSAVAALIGALAGGPGAAMVAAQTGMGAAQGMIAAYSRNQERESDSMGQAIARDAGWDPLAMASFLTSLDQHARMRRGSSRRAGYFDTHPGSIERLTSAAVRYEHAVPLPDDERGRETYLEEVDGLVVGQNPAEGFFNGSRFVHPKLGFSMRFPDGWHTANEPSAVRAISPQGNAMVILEMQGEGDDPEAAAREYSEKVDAPLGDVRAHRINGNPSFSARTQFDLEGSKVKATITWIAHRGRIYRIMGVLPTGRLALGGHFERAARSFRRLGSSERDGFRITRLRMTEAVTGETLDELSLRSQNQWARDETAVMNGRHVDRPFEGGEIVKIAVSERWHPSE